MLIYQRIDILPMVVVSSQQNASVCFVQSLLAAVRPEKGPRNGLGYANQNGDPANQVLQITFVSNEEDRACAAQNALAALKQVPRYPQCHKDM